MINLVVALQPEAAPLIERYRLKPTAGIAGCACFLGDDMRLVVSGMGRVQAAAATSALGCSHAGAGEIWVNIGVAGHRELEIGTPVLGSSVSAGGGSRSWYPPLVVDIACTRMPVITRDSPEREFPENALYEMEAAGFYPVACRFSTGELVQVLKVVSDNRQHRFPALDKKQIRDRIADTLPVLDDLLQGLLRVHSMLPDPAPLENLLRELEKSIHLSVSNRVQLKGLLERHRCLTGSLEPQDLRHARDAGELIGSLRRVVGELALESTSLFGPRT